MTDCELPMKQSAKKKSGTPSKRKQSKPVDIFEAARAGEVESVQACLDAGADPTAVNGHGFTALQCAAAGSDTTAVPKNLAVLKLLLDAGSPLEYVGKGGRTALYLAAEFAPRVDAVQLLIDRGCQVNVCDQFGKDIVANARMPAVKRLLSRVTGQSVPKPERRATPRPTKLTTADWRSVKARLNRVFDALSTERLIALQNAGTTQEDGFSDCSQEWHERDGKAEGLQGFCFYTSEDLRRAKETSQLPLAFWGAPAGAEKDMRRVGALIVKVFQDAGFSVDWNGTGGERPMVKLHGRPNSKTSDRAKR